MGDPKKQRKKYETPNHPWEKERIEEEKQVSKDFGLRNKKEIWKMQSNLKNITAQIKRLMGLPVEQSEVLKNKLHKKLVHLGLIETATPIEEAMDLSLQDVMNRRLQSLVVKKGLARSMNQSRQFITHEHIMIGGKKVTAPSYLVPIDEESTIAFAPFSNYHNADHPERVINEEKAPKIKSSTSKDKKESVEKKETKKVETKKPSSKDKKEKDAPKESKDSTKNKEEKKEEKPKSAEADKK
tara:strand:+ start:3039 stop:3761 length:723 start_codon:yes stop_codon:yes gene_type:complete